MLIRIARSRGRASPSSAPALLVLAPIQSTDRIVSAWVGRVSSVAGWRMKHGLLSDALLPTSLHNLQSQDRESTLPGLPCSVNPTSFRRAAFKTPFNTAIHEPG